MSLFNKLNHIKIPILLFVLIILTGCNDEQNTTETQTPIIIFKEKTPAQKNEPIEEKQLLIKQKEMPPIKEKEDKKIIENETVKNNKIAPTYSEPNIIIEEYYFSLVRKSCERAIQLRPRYNVKKCNESKIFEIPNILVLKENNEISIIHVLTDNKTKKNSTLTAGYFVLKKEKKTGAWLIQEPFYPVTKITKNNLIKKYFAEEKIVKETDKNKIMTFKRNKVNLLNYSTFGSQQILSSCWTPKQLYGNPTKDRKIKHSAVADHSPPALAMPSHQGTALPFKFKGSIRYIPNPDKKIVALTFDLCERAKETTGYDGAIVNYLRKNKIKTTFYAGGKWMRSHPEKTKQLIADPLFEIGNHGWTHGNMRMLKTGEAKRQILWTQGQYEVLRHELKQQCNVPVTEMKKIPPVPLTFRFPYGTCKRESLDMLAKNGLPAVQWNIVTADSWSKQTASGISNTILKQIKPGSIIIAHANGRGHKTSQSLARFIPQLKQQGYQFVTVSELLASAKQIQSSNECYEIRPGDNKRYDRIFGKGTQ